MTTPTAVTEAVQLIFNAYGGKGRTGVDILRGKRMGFIDESKKPMPLFDAVAGQIARVAGMAQAAENKKSLLAHARKIAVRLARTRPITADDVQRELQAQGISVHALGNASGSIFRGKEWEWTGRYIKSSRVHAHANELKEWRLK